MSKKSREIIEKIDASKQVLSTMPQNNIKNQKIYQSKIEELQEEYLQYKKEISEKLRKKYEKFVNIEKDKELDNLKKRIESVENILQILDDEQTSFEKMGLDKSIFIISKYYKDNLENINEQIKNCINKFKMVGISVIAEDFKYSKYSQEYMEVFFQEIKKENINTDKLKTTFEEIYWKCPEIIKHIELNLRSIYLNKKQEIDKYFEEDKNNKIKQSDITLKDVEKKYIELKKMVIFKTEMNAEILKNDFISGKLNIKNFTEDKIKKEMLNVLSEENVDKINNNEEIQKNVDKFLNSLYEYKNYNEFKFIVEDVKNYYNDREKYKKAYEITQKEIENLEKKLYALNKKTARKGLFKNKKENSKQTLVIKDIIQKLNDKYKELELNKFYNKIYLKLNENSTVYDVLKLAYSYYYYLIVTINKNFKDAMQKEVDQKILKLEMFLKNPYNTIINNINFLDESDIAITIKDRYKLLDFNVEKEDLLPDGIDSYISKLKNIQISIILKNANLKVEEIEDFCEIKKMLQL